MIEQNIANQILKIGALGRYPIASRLQAEAVAALIRPNLPADRTATVRSFTECGYKAAIVISLAASQADRPKVKS